jgi:hypothetical protein
MLRVQNMVADWVDVGKKQEILLSKGYHEKFPSCE